MRLRTLVTTLLGMFITTGLAHAATFRGTCELFVNGQSAGQRNCQITTNQPGPSNCPGAYYINVAYDWKGINAWSARFALDGEDMNGSCSSEFYDNSINGTLSGGTINGTITYTWKKGNNVGTTNEIRFQGKTTP